MHKVKLFLFFAVLLFTDSCYANTYANGFSFDEGVLRVSRPVSREYILYSGDTEPEIPEGAIAIRVPVRRFVSSSTTLIPYWDVLGVKEGLVGQGWKSYVFNPEGIASVKDIGPGNNVDIERILELAPDVAFLYASSRSELEIADRLEALGVKVVLAGEYLETHPLGRVEWLSFFAPFFGAEEQAQSYISDTASKYESLRKMTENKIKNRPEVVMNASWGGSWHVPGGKSLFVRFVRDAGGDYKLDTSDGTDGVPLSIETIFSRAAGAEFWLNPSAWRSLNDGLTEDSRYGLFRAFKEGKVYNNTRRMNVTGGNDFHEGGVLRPDVILADLISILHPEILPNRELIYYEKLR